MKPLHVRHIFPSATSHKDVQTVPAFLQRNQAGDLLTFYSDRQSRYEGWFVRNGNSFFKLLERIEMLDIDGLPLQISGITNSGISHYWQYADGTSLGWKLLSTLSGLTVRADRPIRMRVMLDPRDSYDFPEFNRQLTVTQNGTGSLIRYADAKTPRPIFLHVRSRGTFAFDGTWQECRYSRDGARNSSPSQLYAYCLGETLTESLAFGYGVSESIAMTNSLAASRQRPTAPPEGPVYGHQTLVNQVATARFSVQQSLRWLQTPAGQWAGLPWFHQVWSRDELITGLGLTRDLQHQLLDQYVGHQLIAGELATYVGSGTYCADAVGWLCLLASQYASPDFPQGLQGRLISFLRRARSGLLASRSTATGLIRSHPNATWMDTIGRDGVRLEIQCMYGKLLELLFELTGDMTYEQERLTLLAAIRQQFLVNGQLLDGLGDETLRPNIFLAYLLQPELLSARLWQSCFDGALEALWLPWGGLASLDGRDPRFQERSTGEDNRSYQNGDSWFFINNMSAIAMYRLNAKRYGNKINAVLEASTAEILWHNFLGMPGEISSAAELESWGCGLQAFSGGTYLWLLTEIEGGSSERSEHGNASFWDSGSDS